MNELLFIAIALLGSALIAFSVRLGKESLITAITVNLILVSSFGSELISLSGAITNAGNAFYALAIFSLGMLTEFYGRKTALRAIWISFIGVVIFVVLTQITVRFTGATSSYIGSGFFEVVFDKMPRIAVASLFAYLASSHFYVWFHGVLQKGVGFKKIWSRYLASAIATQIIDSILFFCIAFWGSVASNILLEIILVGLISKFVAALISTPFLYWSVRMRHAPSASEA